MVIAIMFMLLVISIAVVGALYSSFLTFYATFWDTLEYNKAYYAATAGLERAELVLRYRYPGYEGSGGWMGSGSMIINDLTIGNSGDHRMSGFSMFSDRVENGIMWDIVSRTTRIPKQQEGNVEWMLVAEDSLDYNMLDYVNAENFTFYIDPWNGNPYVTAIIDRSEVRAFTGIVRLPPALKGWLYQFGPLDMTVDIGGDGITDDAIVDRGFRGRRLEGVSPNQYLNPFQILPTTSLQHYGNKRVIENQDSLLRKTKINTTAPLTWGNTRSPFTISSLTGLTVLSASEGAIKNLTFTDILGNIKISNLLFRISLLNLLYSERKNIYPYLEYQFSFLNESGNPAVIADRFYTITSRGKYGDYEVKLIVKKPTIKESILGSFTVIF